MRDAQRSHTQCNLWFIYKTNSVESVYIVESVHFVPVFNEQFVRTNDSIVANHEPFTFMVILVIGINFICSIKQIIISYRF